MLKDILSITGKPGLFRLVSQGNNMLIVESLDDHKRLPVYARDKVVSLADVSMYSTSDDVPLREVLKNMLAKHDGKRCDIDAKKASSAQLYEYLATVLPECDSDRIYPTDIKKLIKWYNILVDAGITDFDEKEDPKESEDKAE